MDGYRLMKEPKEPELDTMPDIDGALAGLMFLIGIEVLIIICCEILI